MQLFCKYYYEKVTSVLIQLSVVLFSFKIIHSDELKGDDYLRQSERHNIITIIIIFPKDNEVAIYAYYKLMTSVFGILRLRG